MTFAVSLAEYPLFAPPDLLANLLLLGWAPTGFFQAFPRVF